MKRLGWWVTIMAVVLTVGCASEDETADGKVHLEFFQNKPEAVGTYNELIKRFEKEHPNIDVEQNHVPDAETVLRTRLVKGDVPDVMGINGNNTYGDIAEVGVFYNFSGDPVTKKVLPTYREVLNELGRSGKETNGVPFAANANVVLYNKETFAELGLEVPKTWDELIEVAETIEEAGETPFYFAYKDAWTAMVPFNSLAANIQGDRFFDQRKRGEATFTQEYRPVAEKMLTLLEYSQPDPFGRGYNDGNLAFANGDTAMLIQGSWAISAIRKANPEIKIGSFPLPSTNDPDKNRLVSGVDTVLTMSKETEHQEESLAFIRFLMKGENVQYYMKEQNTFPTVKGMYQQEPSLASLRPYFEEQRIEGFPEHQFSPAIPLQRLIQGFLVDGNPAGFLKKLDEEWNKVEARQS
ncbi:raffinose/stachyose/melibiose transport system substrate-binding protein [Melghirimyces thermohalophilus]|uniref:Raffinose/stachyose/melibiose transport system substrate-binding protein n=1 Tax=Melghirimyces thermohalophilus TaxID=1236220 RepID=A0A1G6NP87_9BACL|nr:extracellular solute-binding protein [Melghirimyces thermohalophilus]SDC68975.1 raffinose/stachyose/melibiose transport system substrate-binding protein [Melghirimyces thermohalophilus]